VSGPGSRTEPDAGTDLSICVSDQTRTTPDRSHRTGETAARWATAAPG